MMKSVFDKKRVGFYLWVGFGLLLLWQLGDIVTHRELIFERTLNKIWLLSYLIVLNYLLFEYILPQISRKRILSSVLSIITVILLSSYGLYVWRNIGILLHVYTPLIIFSSRSHGLSAQMENSVMSYFFFGIIRHIYNYIKLKQTAQLLRIEKQQAELNYLRSQTNPHFLFNTLNNIYSLARDKSDLAPESILRLSKILRFMLYETSGAFIAVEQELKIISDYIALEKLRYDDSLRVNFNYDVEDMKQAIPPLLLIPLVENAFKHGVSETRDLPFVDIHLSIKQRQLIFTVKNSAEANPDVVSVRENIGLSNLRRQLELLYTDFHLLPDPAERIFTATLQINLASHV